MFNRTRRPDFHSVSILASVLTVITLAAGCDFSSENGATATQVVAKVNGDEITMHQINNVLERAGNVTPETVDETKRQILDRLIDQQLAVQKAVENKLDRSPEVMQAIEAAKNEILARAYLEQIAERTPQRFDWDLQNKEEIADYYSKHPELFSQRRMFAIEELSFAANNDVAVRLQKHMSQSRSMEEISSWLQSQNIKFAARRIQRPAEQMSLRHLPQVQSMKPGAIALFDLGNERFQVIRVVTFKEAPISIESATPRIAQYLSNQQTRNILAAEMKRIKDEAQIEYVGEFAGVDSVAQATTASEDFTEERAQK